MRTRTKFIVGLVAAAVTYGSLWAIAGPRHYGRYGYQGRGAHCSWRADGRTGYNPRQNFEPKFNQPESALTNTVTIIL